MLLKRLTPEDCVLLFDERGKMLPSPDFAKLIESKIEDGVKRIIIIVGGAYGVGDTVRARANHIIAFSPMIFPHQLARIMALEQAYRALSILAGSKYHHE
jgi:23S rRNA (pseudouridine1915-N3)-methyltransferase